MQSHHKMSEKFITIGSPFLIVGVLLAMLQKKFMMFIYLFFIIFILSLCIFCPHVCLCPTCVNCPGKPEEGVGCPGPGVTGCELS